MMHTKEFEALINTLEEIKQQNSITVPEILQELNALTKLVKKQTEIMEKFLDKDKPNLAYDQQD